MSARPAGADELSRRDVPRATSMLADAFRDDPLWRAVIDGADDPGCKLARVFEAPLRYCRRYGHVYTTGPAMEGVAAWVPGERADMTTWRLLRSGALGPALHIGVTVGRRMQEVFDPVLRDRRSFMDGRAYVYLLVLGVAPKHQGRGHGGRLVRRLFAECDRRGVPLYLETETEGNVSMYRSLGFRLIKRVRLPILGLPMWEMVREPTG